MFSGTKNTRVMCNLDKHLALASGKCQESDCVQHCPVTCYIIYGCCIVIQGQCSSGHEFVWTSSNISMNQSKNRSFKNKRSLSSAVVLSGLSYYKVSDCQNYWVVCVIKYIISFLSTTLYLSRNTSFL